jgi:gamma-glutamyltranspeptidase / glutathione hydrolase
MRSECVAPPLKRIIIAIACLLLFSTTGSTAAFADPPPATASKRAAHGIVVSESVEGAAAGLAIMEKGGNAVDAACAAEMASCLTNAASCGVGGGGFMLIYVAKTSKFYALDYRERAPLKATATMYLRGGKADEELARKGPLSIGVPGDIAGLAAALHRFGTMKFQQVAAPTIKLARDGFALTPHLAHEIAWASSSIKRDPALASTFLKPDGTAPAVSALIYNKKLAETLEGLGNDPVEKFYHGEIAKELAKFVEAQGGILSEEDFKEYSAVWRKPLHRAYRGYEVYAMPPPSSGGVVLEMLGMLEPGHLGGLGADSPPYLARLIEVMRQGFIDRQQYADPAFVAVPIDKLLSPEHIDDARARALHHSPTPPKTPAAHDHGTLALLTADSEGNVVALTTTINTIFGSGLMDPKTGIILNDEMDDFAVAPGVPNVYRLQGAKINEVAPGKRPLSSMSPTIVINKGAAAFAAAGSGGPTIVSGVLQILINMIDFHLGPAMAVQLPRIHDQAAPDLVLVEQKMPETTRKALSEMGYTLRVVPELGAVCAIKVDPGNLNGAADPRKGGMAASY